MRILCLFLAILLFAGCTTVPTANQLAAADYGMPIDQDRAELIASTWLDYHLRDPDSAIVDWTEAQRGWMNTSPVLPGIGRNVFGYRLDATVNAKNAFGGYAGAKPYVFIFQDESLTHVWGYLRSSRGTYYLTLLAQPAG